MEGRVLTRRRYTGYLTPFVECIRAMHGAGAGTGETAAALYELGARGHQQPERSR